MQIYFRKSKDTEDEYNECKKYFHVVPNRALLTESGGTVICRYSALPFNKELENDLVVMGLSPINSSVEHSYIAEMDWIYDITEYTFPTYFNLHQVPLKNYPIVIKGRTNSRKFEWNTRMFANNLTEANDISTELSHDPLIGPQGLVFRQYVPLETYEVGINDMPMTNEWRCFFYKGKLIDYGFYWSILDDMTKIGENEFEQTGLVFAHTIAQIIKEHTNFYVIDVARDIHGKWWVVEINDGQMSGLSCIPPDRFYFNLYKIVQDD